MLYEAMHAVIPPLARAVWRPEVVGLDHVPAADRVVARTVHFCATGSYWVQATTAAPLGADVQAKFGYVVKYCW